LEAVIRQPGLISPIGEIRGYLGYAVPGPASCPCFRFQRGSTGSFHLCGFAKCGRLLLYRMIYLSCKVANSWISCVRDAKLIEFGWSWLCELSKMRLRDGCEGASFVSSCKLQMDWTSFRKPGRYITSRSN